MKLNLPNKLTVLRVIMIPLFMVFLIFPIFGENVSRIVAAALFALTAFTDFLDGNIARKYNLITDFGKFLDPLADKLMVFGALLAIIVHNRADDTFVTVFVWAAFIIMLRELAVTSLRLIVSSGEKIVIAANWLGKIKTVTQIACILTVLLEPVITGKPCGVVSYILIAAMTVMTLWSGINYFVAYLPHINPDK